MMFPEKEKEDSLISTSKENDTLLGYFRLICQKISLEELADK